MVDYHRRKIERPAIEGQGEQAQEAHAEEQAAQPAGSGIQVEVLGQILDLAPTAEADITVGGELEAQLLSCIGGWVNITWELAAASGDPWEGHPNDIKGTCSAAGRIDGGWLTVTVDGVTYYVPEDREVSIVVRPAFAPVSQDVTKLSGDTNSPLKPASATRFAPPPVDFSDVEGFQPVGTQPQPTPLSVQEPAAPDNGGRNIVAGDTQVPANAGGVEAADPASPQAPVVPLVLPAPVVQAAPIVPVDPSTLGHLGGWYLEVLATADPLDERTPYDRATPDEPQFMYIAGTAGTGKTYVARLRSTNYDDAMLCATTGIAAVNLGGVTINSVLRYYDTASMRTEFEFGRLSVALRQMCGSGFTRLVVDEASMMDGQQLDILTMAVDEVNEWRVSNHEKPIGITLVGDFAQLPPVDAPFVFERPSWQRFEPNTLMLTEPRRQADPDFVRALQAVRRGDLSAVDYFRPFITKADDIKFDGSSILAKNVEVDRMNNLRMLDLKGPEWTSKAVRADKEAPEWKIIPDELRLKPDALVMILANAYDRTDPMAPELIYANGDLGHFTRPGADDPQAGAFVRLHRTGQEVYVNRVTRENLTPTGKKGRPPAKREEVLGTISYLPLRVAYGTTVHKSQGLSLDNVQLMINSQFWMQSGMLYVALSRARTPQGLKIVGTPDQFRARIRSNPKIARWL